MWQLQSKTGELLQEASKTTFKYVIKRFPGNDEVLSEILASAEKNEDDQVIQGIIGSEDSGKENDEKTIIAQNRAKKYPQHPHREVDPFPQGVILLPFPTTKVESKASMNNDSGRNESPPRSPKGVDEIANDGLSFEAFDDFPDEKNPFRVSSAPTAKASTRVETPTKTDIAPVTRAVTPKVSNALAKDFNVMEELEQQQPSAESSIEAFRTSTEVESKNQKYLKDVGQTSINSELSKTAAVPGDGTSIYSPSTMQFEDVITPKLRLHIDDYDSKFFKKLMHDLMCQKRVCNLDIYRSWQNTSDRNRTTDEMALFFKMVQSLPNLHTLHLANMEASTDLCHFHDAIAGHHKLQDIRIHVTCGSIDERTLRTLKNLPRLTEASFETTKSFDFSVLLRSTTLRRLHIGTNGSYIFDNSHLMALMPMLECNSVLVELDLEPQMSFLAFKFMAYALRINKSIQVLQISIEPTTSQALIDQAMTEISTVLSMNSTLRVFHNVDYRSLYTSVPNCRKVLRALEANVAMEHFHLFKEDSSFNKEKKHLLKPTETTSAAGTQKKIRDRSRFKSSMASFQTEESNEEPLDETQTSGGSSLPFCAAFDAIELLSVIQKTSRVIRTAKKQSEKFKAALYDFLADRRRTNEEKRNEGKTVRVSIRTPFSERSDDSRLET